MNKDAYPVKVAEKELCFEFESVSNNKVLKKVIAYELIDKKHRIYNLSLVDVDENGFASDLAVSNNADLEKVLATVIQTLPYFFLNFPEASVFFQGSTSSRTRLYQIVIGRIFEEASRLYYIHGFQNGTAVPFVKNRRYEAFLISQKPTQNEIVR